MHPLTVPGWSVLLYRIISSIEEALLWDIWILKETHTGCLKPQRRYHISSKLWEQISRRKEAGCDLNYLLHGESRMLCLGQRKKDNPSNVKDPPLHMHADTPTTTPHTLSQLLHWAPRLTFHSLSHALYAPGVGAGSSRQRKEGEPRVFSCSCNHSNISG